MKTTFQNARIGDKVFSHTFGWGKIEFVDTSLKYAICVRFINEPSCSIPFTIEGYYYEDMPIQSLFWDEIDIKAPVKPVTTKVINGVEIPDISFKPNEAEACYVASPTRPSLYDQIVYFYPSELNNHLRDSNLCYPYTDEGRQVAILHAKAMLGDNSPQ
jgi:hypothetical protein